MNRIKHYFSGLLAAMFNGGISSLATIMGIDSVSLTGASTSAHVLTGHEMLTAFLCSCVAHGILWLKTHPLPEDQDPAVATPVITKPDA